jgi:hypothetical protein
MLNYQRVHIPKYILYIPISFDDFLILYPNFTLENIPGLKDIPIILGQSQGKTWVKPPFFVVKHHHFLVNPT